MIDKLGYSAEFPKSLGFEKIEKTVVDLLAEEKFGILTEIDVKATFKKKLDIDFKPYKILGACSPPRAHKVLNADLELGLLLPCNVVIYENDNDMIVVSLINAYAMFELVSNESIKDVVKEVSDIFSSVLDKLKGKLL